MRSLTGAFYGCSSLTSITIPDSVTEIGSALLAGCSALTALKAPDFPSNSAFVGVFFGATDQDIPTKLKSVTITKPSHIASATFTGCARLTSVSIGDCSYIEFAALAPCTSLTSITLPFVGYSPTSTENTIFGYIFGASKSSEGPTYVPSTLKYITISGTEECDVGDYSFSLLTNIKGVSFGKNVKSIGTYAFLGCTSLENITFSEGLTSIGDSAFYDCPALNDFTIPASVTKIGQYAFSSVDANPVVMTMLGSTPPTIYANSLSDAIYRIYVPYGTVDTYKTTGNWVNFADRIYESYSNVVRENITYGLVQEYAAVRIVGIEELGRTRSVVIPGVVDGVPVTRIEDGAINDSTIVSLTIPASVDYIGEAAIGIGGRNNAATLIMQGAPPVIEEYSISMYVEKIIVPVGYGNAYKASKNWSTYADIIEEAST